MKNPTL